MRGSTLFYAGASPYSAGAAEPLPEFLRFLQREAAPTVPHLDRGQTPGGPHQKLPTRGRQTALRWLTRSRPKNGPPERQFSPSGTSSGPSRLGKMSAGLSAAVLMNRFHLIRSGRPRHRKIARQRSRMAHQQNVPRRLVRVGRRRRRQQAGQAQIIARPIDLAPVGVEPAHVGQACRGPAALP